MRDDAVVGRPRASRRTGGAERVPRTGSASRPAAAADLHADIPELVAWLGRAVHRDDALDAYLTACAIGQVMDDRAEGTDTLARRLAALPGAVRGMRGLIRRGVGLPARLLTRWRGLLPRGRTLRAQREQVGRLVALLADDVAGHLAGHSGDGAGQSPPAGEQGATAIGERARVLIDALAGGWADAAGRDLARPASCFRSFDQHPLDCAELARRFAQRHPDRRTPVLVLGVRTSGAYLAPLLAAFLRLRGFACDAATMRPGGALPRERFARLRGPVPGRVVVVDDPPSSGAAIARAVGAVRAEGFETAQVVAVYASFADEAARALPPDVPRIVLGAKDWHIRKLLSQDSVLDFVRDTFADQDLLEVACDEPGLPNRSGGHLGVRATAWLRGERGLHRLDLRAEGVGTGYLGRHALAVAARLPGMTPHVYALRDGVMLRAAGEPLAGRSVPLNAAAGYVAARRERLPVPEDRSSLLRGRQPAWEVAGRILAGGFGRAGAAVRPLLLDQPLRALTRTPAPCLIDGTTVLSGWETAAGGVLHKSDFEDGAFSHLDLACYDAAYDLAGVAVGRPGSESALLAQYEAVTGERVDRVRWCVYRCVQAWNLRRLGEDGRDRADRAQARALQELFSRLYLGDLPEPEGSSDGPWVVLDVDGVLELDFGGVPSPTAASMMALRALRVHGYRTLLATGRSLPEVRDRCAAYRLVGGVAEYGAVAIDAGNGSVYDLVTDTDWDEQRKLLRDELAAFPDVRLDPKYRWCVRASGFRGVIGALPHTVAIPGDAQTDFIPSGVDKATGIRALLALLGEGHAEVALAVGDTAMDLSMLRMATLGLAPGHAAKALRDEGVQCTRAPYQAGLAQAVGRLVGHRPGACDLCAPPILTPPERFVTSLVGVGERGRRGLAPALLSLAAQRFRLREKGERPWN